MTSTSLNIFVGIISGVLSSLVVFILLGYLKNIIIPWYRQIIYTGVDIEGKWLKSSKNPSGNHQDESLTITQKANTINCSLTVVKRLVDGKVIIKEYRLDGVINDRLVTLTGSNIDKKTIGSNVLLLEVIGGGSQMLGYEAWYSATNSKIDSAVSEWSRE